MDTLTFNAVSLRRIRFAATASLLFAAASIAAIPFEIVDSVADGFDAFVLLPLSVQLAFGLLVGRTGLALRRVAEHQQRADLARALVGLRIYFAAHGVFLLFVAALMLFAIAGALLML